MQLRGVSVLTVVLTSTMLLAGCAHVNALMGKKGDSDAAPAATAPDTSKSTQSAAPVKQTSNTEATDAESDKGIYGNPPAGSPFSRIKVGMSGKEVIDLIGPPTDQKAYVTGKAFIPFYFGGDTSREEYRYKHQGVITLAGSGAFSSAYTVYRVIYNPLEGGYEH